MNKRPLALFTSVWGPGHIEWFEKSCIRSLLWPKNNPSLKEATWHIFTRPQDEEKVRAGAIKVGVKEIKIHQLPGSLEGMPRQMGLILLDAFMYVMEECLKNSAQLLTAPPDTIFSDGTIPNLIQMAKYGDTVVVVPHARVNASIFGSIRDEPLSSKELVELVFKHQHLSWKTSEISTENQSSFIGGICWQKLGGKQWAVQHMLPTPYLINFISSDQTFFRTSHDGSEPVYGAIDHLWGTSLIKDERQRMPGSSDAACIVEVTKEELNIPAKVQCNPWSPDEFWRGAPHNRHNRQSYFIMNGEG